MTQEALNRIAEKLRLAGASLPAPEVTGTIEGSIVTGLCIALALVESEIETLAQQEQEPLEYWNAVEGWVKIDEVRKHFDSVGCGTIYKSAGEGRVPLCLAQPEQKPVAREHVTDSSKCWCDPELDYKNPDTGVEVWVHRSKQ